MGTCGCGDYGPSMRLPGPDGTVYTIQRSNGCTECGTPCGITVYRHDADTARQWRDEELPEMIIHPYSEGEVSGAASIALFDPEVFRSAMQTAANECAADEDMDADEIFEAMTGAVDEAMWQAYLKAGEP